MAAGPAKLTGDPHGQALLDALDDERQLLGPLQAMIDDAFTMNADPGRLRQLLVRLRTRLASHLAHEEADALPLMSQFLSPGELGAIAAAIRGERSIRRAGPRSRGPSPAPAPTSVNRYLASCRRPPVFCTGRPGCRATPAPPPRYDQHPARPASDIQ